MQLKVRLFSLNTLNFYNGYVYFKHTLKITRNGQMSVVYKPSKLTSACQTLGNHPIKKLKKNTGVVDSYTEYYNQF